MEEGREGVREKKGGEDERMEGKIMGRTERWWGVALKGCLRHGCYSRVSLGTQRH